MRPTNEPRVVVTNPIAEDPATDFLPSVGPLDIFSTYVNFEYIRTDTGVEQGGEVSIFYDPMIAKIIAYGDNRNIACVRLMRACKLAHVFPIKTNARFLVNCLAHKGFVSGDVSTHFITEHADVLMPTTSFETDKLAIARTLAPETGATAFTATDGWRPNQPARDYFVRVYNGEEIKLPVNVWHPKAAHYSRPEGDVVFVDGLAYLIEVPADTSGALGGGNAITAPMPGKIISVNAKAGDAVTSGDPLIIMEAMKMEMTLEAPRDGVVAEINTQADALVGDGDVLLTLEDE